MAVGPVLRGIAATLRPIEIGDAARAIAIRNTPGFEVGLPPIPDDIRRQQDWIRAQREARDDYYYCVESLPGNATEGLIGLTAEPTVQGPWCEGGEWEWGRWASVARDPRTAVEGAALLIGLAMEWELPGVWVRVQSANSRLVAFHSRLGYSSHWSTDSEDYFRAQRTDVPTLHRRLGGQKPQLVG